VYQRQKPRRKSGQMGHPPLVAALSVFSRKL
jgi:hypothetical protein